MAFVTIKNVRIAAVATAVPSTIVDNDDSVVFSDDYNAADFVKTTGVEHRRFSNTLTASDLCFHASQKLLETIKWDTETIDAIIFCSQTPDYIMPATACVLQHRLNLSTECYATDMSLGCSGWAYGLVEIASLISAANGSIRRALLMVGDAKTRAVGTPDPLFGHAGSVTALEFDSAADPILAHLGTDGSGFDSIITPDGGSRHPVSPVSFKEEQIDGHTYHRVMMRMKGMDVFSFAISVPPKSIKKLTQRHEINLDSVDFFLFHQANKMILDKLVKKLHLESSKVPVSITDFGNTFSASIPTTINACLNDSFGEPRHMIACGYGVGMSWATIDFHVDKNFIALPIIEVEDEIYDDGL